jgi:hypothetical protein
MSHYLPVKLGKDVKDKCVDMRVGHVSHTLPTSSTVNLELHLREHLRLCEQTPSCKHLAMRFRHLPLMAYWVSLTRFCRPEPTAAFARFRSMHLRRLSV